MSTFIVGVGSAQGDREVDHNDYLDGSDLEESFVASLNLQTVQHMPRSEPLPASKLAGKSVADAIEDAGNQIGSVKTLIMVNRYPDVLEPANVTLINEQLSSNLTKVVQISAAGAGLLQALDFLNDDMYPAVIVSVDISSKKIPSGTLDIVDVAQALTSSDAAGAILVTGDRAVAGQRCLEVLGFDYALLPGTDERGEWIYSPAVNETIRLERFDLQDEKMIVEELTSRVQRFLESSGQVIDNFGQIILPELSEQANKTLIENLSIAKDRVNNFQNVPAFGGPHVLFGLQNTLNTGFLDAPVLAIIYDPTVATIGCLLVEEA